VARIPYIDPETAAPAVREAFERLPVKLNIFKLFAHAETGFRPLLRFGSSILGQQKLSGKLRELAILRVARLSGAEYEWVQHVPIAKAAGANDAQIEALSRDDAKAPCFDETERLVLQFTDEVVRDVGASDATFRALAAQLSPRELVELVLAIGFYMTVARIMETFQIDLDPPAGSAIIDSVRPR
jgi:alkylhydroperoxidase family enzyme